MNISLLPDVIRPVDLFERRKEVWCWRCN